MKKKLLSLLLLVMVSFTALVGCDLNKPASSSETIGSSSSGTVDNSSIGEIEKVDYAASLKLNMESASKKLAVKVKTYIDGDTTHFEPLSGEYPTALTQREKNIKARYAAVNTPESTGTIEPWGKKASNFTKEKLQSASSIIIETDEDDWKVDSTGGRYMLWVWYKPQGESDYRNLNLELLQEGLAIGSKTSNSRYGEICMQAISQANALSLYVYSNEQDPDFYYGDAIELDLKELRTNIEKYVGKRVAFEGIVSTYSNWTIHVEAWDEETQMSYGMPVFYGYNGKFHKFLATGNKVRIVGNLTYSENYGYQVSSLEYNDFRPNDPENIQKLGEGYTGLYTEVSVEKFLSKESVTIEQERVNEETGETETFTETKEIAFAELALSTTLSMKDLRVVDMYTTNNGGDNDGAISITCKDASGNQVDIRIDANIKDKDGVCIFTENDFKGKTIDVKGVVESYNGKYQLKVYLENNVTIH